MASEGGASGGINRLCRWRGSAGKGPSLSVVLEGEGRKELRGDTWRGFSSSGDDSSSPKNISEGRSGTFCEFVNWEEPVERLDTSEPPPSEGRFNRRFSR